jgi:hypothetical protein
VGIQTGRYLLCGTCSNYSHTTNRARDQSRLRIKASRSAEAGGSAKHNATRVWRLLEHRTGCLATGQDRSRSQVQRAKKCHINMEDVMQLSLSITSYPFPQLSLLNPLFVSLSSIHYLPGSRSSGLLDIFVRLLSMQIAARRSLPPWRKKPAGNGNGCCCVRAVRVVRTCTHKIRSWIRAYIWH